MIPKEWRELVLDTSLSDGAKVTAEVYGILGERVKQMTQGEIAQVRGVSSRQLRTHLRELDRKKTSAPISNNRTRSKGLRRVPKYDDWGVRRDASKQPRCKGLGCFGLVAEAIRELPLEACDASMLEKWDGLKWVRLGEVAAGVN